MFHGNLNISVENTSGIPFSDTELSLPLFVILLSFPRLFLEGTGIILFIIFSPILTASSTDVCDAFTAVEMLGFNNINPILLGT